MITLTKMCPFCGEELVIGEPHMCKGMVKSMMPPEIKPTSLNARDTWGYVIEDILARNEMGRLKYGVTLTPETDQNMTLHLYEELLDAVVYLKTLIIQRGLEKHVYQD